MAGFGRKEVIQKPPVIGSRAPDAVIEDIRMFLQFLC